MPSRVLKFKTPCQVLLESFPNTHLVSNIPPKIFGCTAFVHIHPHQRSKLDPKASKCIFLGYSPNQKGYKCYSPSERKFFISMDVTFFENTPYYTDVQGGYMIEHPLTSEGIHTDPIQPFPPISSNTKEDQAPFSQVLETEPTQTNLSQPSTDPSTSPMTSPDNTHLNPQKETLVYSRKRKHDKEVQPVQSEHCHESQPIPTPESQGTSPSDPTNADNLDVPIALRKGVRACTSHPIKNFVSYKELSPNYRAFVSKLDETQIPNSIHEALQILAWKDATFEESRR